MNHTHALVLGAAAAAAGLWAWGRWHPVSFWYAVGYPLRAVWVYLTWAHVASACGLAHKRRRYRYTLDAFPVVGPAARSAALSASRSASMVVEQRRRLRRVEVERAPRIRWMLPTRLGWRMSVKLTDGQIPDDYTKVTERLAHAWRVHAVRVLEWRPGQLTLVATRTDPLTEVTCSPEATELLTVRVGTLENGQPWIIDFRTVPHYLNAGATQSGKSNLANAIIRGLAPQPVALVGFDLKGGVEFTPYAARLSALATTRAECVALLEDLAAILADRMTLCRTRGARNVWRLPEPLRPTPIVVLVDEVAELFLMADKSEKDEVSKTATALLRVAQLGRAFAVYLMVCGQRIGADLGPGVTALRSQLSGRICHRVNDPETATMTLGDMDPNALEAARKIAANTPGVAVIAGSDGSWHRARSVLTTEEQAEHAARNYAHLTPGWAALADRRPPAVPDTRAA
jgi:S-DNA-T family DNA segregation ATPase FtsK/SpoIIIE